MKTASRPEVHNSIRRNLLIGLIALVLVAGGLGVWAAIAELSGAVIAAGRLVVESNVKKVQHPTGGVVGEVLVREGDHVSVGEVVVRLDDTQTRANLAVFVNSISELTAREARLDAERLGNDEIAFPDSLLTQQADLLVNKIIVGEQKHFELRRGARAGQKDQLRERLNQMQEQIHGLNKQVDAKQREIKLVFKELEGLRGLWAKRLVTISKLTHVEREAARLEGELGELIASTAEAKGKVAEIGLQIIQVDHELRSQVAEELSDVRAKLAELAERKIAAEDQLKRVDIRATQTGTVHELTVHTIGGVVAPGDPIMLIVPDSDSLVVEARVQPADIDQLSTGQVAALRFSAFNQRVTPEVSGRVTRIAPDVTQDQSSGETYYLVRVAIDRDAAEKLQNVSLVPGMPVEVFLQTGPRSALSYLLKPLQDQVARAFRDT